MPKIDISTLDPATTVVVATHNAHKLTEIKEILSPAVPDFNFVALSDLGDFEEPEEDGSTFFDNACIKARAALLATGLKMAIADDSGICVDALDGAPGIHSARYVGHHGDDAANNELLLKNLEGVEERGAHFHSTVVMIWGPNIVAGYGNCPGTIGFEERGKGGFGYDPLFYPEATPGKTMAELTAEEKNAISHRFYALQDLAEKVRTQPPVYMEWDEEE